MNVNELSKMYSRCEVTIVALQDRREEQEDIFYNIYSLVELCTAKQFKSESIGKSGRSYSRYKINKKYNLFIRREFLDNIQDGLNFYVGKGAIHLLNKDILQDYGQLSMEPPNGECVLFSMREKSETSLGKILPNFDRSIWLAMKLSEDDKFLSLLTEEERWKANGFIETELGINLGMYTEFWGGYFLCGKNTQLRTLDYQLGKDRKSLVMTVLADSDDEVYNGWMELFDERRYGTGFYIRKKIEKSHFLVPFPYEPERLHVRVFNNDGKLIIDKSSTFIQKIKFNMGIQSAQRVFLRGNERTKVDMKEYTKFSVGERCNIIEDRSLRAAHERYLASLEKDRVFIYFAGQKEERERAHNIVRELIGGARERCIICDPYFSSKDFLNYGIQVTSLDIMLKIITSAAFLKDKIDGEPETSQGDLLSSVIQSVTEQGFSVQCHVLRGKKSPLHDRFIVVDDDVYLLGSSLSEFGSRATTLYRVPNPNLLIRQAERWMSDEEKCPLIEEWMQSKGGEDDEGNNTSWNNRAIGDRTP